MNKIIVDKEKNVEIKDNVVELAIKVNELVLNIKGKVLIQEINTKKGENLNLIINMADNSSLIYNRFMVQEGMTNNITINQNNNSQVVFNYSIEALSKCKLNIMSKILGNNNETDIKIKAVTEDKGSCNIVSTLDTYPKIQDNNLIESIKILILNNEESVCVPNLLVSSDKVEVNHACTISSIDKNSLFYLNSKGLNDEDAIKLIRDGYLIGNLDINDEIKDKIKKILGGE